MLNTPDKKRIVIPNGGLSNGSIINYSAEPIRRVEWTFGIGYSDNIDKAREIIMECLEADNRISRDPQPAKPDYGSSGFAPTAVIPR